MQFHMTKMFPEYPNTFFFVILKKKLQKSLNMLSENRVAIALQYWFIIIHSDIP